VESVQAYEAKAPKMASSRSASKVGLLRRFLCDVRVRLLLFAVFTAAFVFYMRKGGSGALRKDLDPVRDGYLPRGGRTCPGAWCESRKELLKFGMVADLDRQSSVESGRHTKWRSVLKRAVMRQNPSGGWDIEWEEDVELVTKLGEDGRGLELSELISWEGKLWTFDDRSGVLFELDQSYKCIPRYILMEGDGATTKGQKTEWATVKDGMLFVGSFGKPYTMNGEITSTNNLWISIIHPSGLIEHKDWTKIYERMQKDTDSIYPGYMIHEAIHFDEINRLWYVLPRRVSRNAYDEKEDERMGSNLVLIYSEDFSVLEHKFEVGEKVATHGWSSFKFVPFTNNKVIIGLRSMEIENKETGEGEQATFITVFNVNGEVYLPEQEIPGPVKFEGLEFL